MAKLSKSFCWMVKTNQQNDFFVYVSSYDRKERKGKVEYCCVLRREQTFLLMSIWSYTRGRRESGILLCSDARANFSAYVYMVVYERKERKWNIAVF